MYIYMCVCVCVYKFGGASKNGKRDFLTNFDLWLFPREFTLNF